MYASDDALCYQHLSADMQPTGSKKQIPYASIEFVGARARAGTPHTCLGGPAGLLPRPAQAAASSTRAGLALSRRSHPLSPCAAAQVRLTSSSSWSSARGARSRSCATRSRRERSGSRTSPCSPAAPPPPRSVIRRRRWATETLGMSGRAPVRADRRSPREPLSFWSRRYRASRGAGWGVRCWGVVMPLTRRHARAFCRGFPLSRATGASSGELWGSSGRCVICWKYS